MAMTDVPNGNISFLKGFAYHILITKYTSIRRMETESPCSTKNMGLFGEWRRNLHKFSGVLTCFGEWRRNLHEFSSVLTCLGEWRRILHQKAKVSFYFPPSEVFFSSILFKRKKFCHSSFSLPL